jgi:hypothetical protein
MGHPLLRRALAATAALVLTTAIAAPVLASGWHGTVTCPYPVMHIYFQVEADGQAPGGPAYYYNSPGYWYKDINANYGGGYWTFHTDYYYLQYPTFTC